MNRFLITLSMLLCLPVLAGCEQKLTNELPVGTQTISQADRVRGMLEGYVASGVEDSSSEIMPEELEKLRGDLDDSTVDQLLELWKSTAGIKAKAQDMLKLLPAAASP